MSQGHDQSANTIAEDAVERDLQAAASFPNNEVGINPLSRTTTSERLELSRHSLASRYRRASHNEPSLRPLAGEVQTPPASGMNEQDREMAIEEERSLLEDNNLLGRKQSRKGSSRSASQPSGAMARKKLAARDEETGDAAAVSEQTPLLANGGVGGGSDGPDSPGSPASDDVDQKWEEAVLAGKIKTTWQREAKTVVKNSLPLMLTFFLQNSFTLVSIFTVGHIDKIALGAVSIGSMTAAITGFATIHGLATALDTLCPQAYGSGNKTLVGLQLQRMIAFLMVVMIPLAVIWLFASQILAAIIPEKDVAALAGQYLKILIIGMPAYAAFEASKRFVNSQGKFRATMYVLLFCAPLNVFLHWLFVWHFQWGFIGCPIAVVITENMSFVLLVLYIRFTDAKECWGGFSRAAFKNWGPMIRLALPGLAMILAEYLAFEILTLSASWIDSTTLAAQAILQNLSVQTYMLPFPVSIASSNRIANFIGATLPEAAKVTARVTFVLGTIVGIFNMVWLSALRFQIPILFTNDEDVIKLAAAVLPINAAFQLFDALAAQCNGVLRGLGRQEVGGYICMFAYYVVAIPLAFGTAFGLKLGIYGLWLGPLSGLFVTSLVEGIYIWHIDWAKTSEEAAERNAAG